MALALYRRCAVELFKNCKTCKSVTFLIYFLLSHAINYEYIFIPISSDCYKYFIDFNIVNSYCATNFKSGSGTVISEMCFLAITRSTLFSNYVLVSSHCNCPDQLVGTAVILHHYEHFPSIYASYEPVNNMFDMTLNTTGLTEY